MQALREIVGSEFVKDDPAVLSAYGIDGVNPWAVVFPGSTAEVSEVVRLAHSENLSLVPRGGGTKIGMGNAPECLDLVLGMERLNRIVDMDKANLTVTMEAGVRFKELRSALAGEENRCYLPLKDPGTPPDDEICSQRENLGCFIPMAPPFSDSATLGGIIAANSIGHTQLLYGLPRDMVLGVRFVTPTGEIVGMGGKTVKNVSGYDVVKLMIGSRGSLGILCETTLRLLPLPEDFGTGLFVFADLEGATGFVNKIFETRLLPAAVEVLNRKACERLLPEDAPEPGKGGYAVAVAIEGVKEAVHRMALEFAEMGAVTGAGGHHYLQGVEHHLFWEDYSNLVTRLSGLLPDLVSVRINVPIARSTEFMDFAESRMGETRLDCAILSHAGTGMMHLLFLLPRGDVERTEEMIHLVDRLMNRSERLEGNLVVERAMPGLKKRLPLWGLPPEDITLMKRLKEQMDPRGILCPGRFVGGI